MIMMKLTLAFLLFVIVVIVVADTSAGSITGLVSSAIRNSAVVVDDNDVAVVL